MSLNTYGTTDDADDLKMGGPLVPEVVRDDFSVPVQNKKSKNISLLWKVRLTVDRHSVGTGWCSKMAAAIEPCFVYNT